MKRKYNTSKLYTFYIFICATLNKIYCAKLDWLVDAVAKTEKESFEKTLNACHIIMYENAHNRYYDELRVVFDKLLWSYYT